MADFELSERMTYAIKAIEKHFGLDTKVLNFWKTKSVRIKLLKKKPKRHS